MQKVKDAGVAGLISYMFWELGFWGISIPVCIIGYREVTGHWPDLANQEDVAQLSAEAFAFVNLARFAVPLRIGLALSTTPWVQSNIVDSVVSRRQLPPPDMDKASQEANWRPTNWRLGDSAQTLWAPIVLLTIILPVCLTLAPLFTQSP